MADLSQYNEQILTLLIYTTLIAIIIITVFLTKLLIDLSNLARSSQSIVTIVKHELEPTLRELKRALININSVTHGADDINNTINSGINILSSSTTGLLNKTRVIASSLRQGITAGLRVFLEERKAK